MNKRNSKNVINIIGEVATIKIKSRIHGVIEFIVDADMVPLVKDYVWWITNPKTNSKYLGIATMINRKVVRLSHFILGKPPEGYIVDHIDRNPLNNLRNNLRFVTHQENTFNSNALGVMIVNDRFRARITKNGHCIHLGYFSTIEEARKAYLHAKTVYHQIGTFNKI